jgi:hypothetical protein
MTTSKDPRDEIYKDIDEAMKSGDSKRLIKALKHAVLRTEEDMDKGREEFEIKYGGTVEERIATIDKLIAANEEINVVRAKHGLPEQDSIMNKAEIDNKMDKVEELVYGDFISSIKTRLEALKKAYSENKKGAK